jgi:copper transport protein
VDHDPVPLPIDLFAAGRTLAYLASLTLVGACAFAFLVPRWRRENDDDRSLPARALERTWAVAAWASALLIAAHLIRGYGQVRSFLEPFEPFTLTAARPILLQTAWGRGWQLQFAAALTCLPLAFAARRRPAPGLGLLATAVIAVTAASPLTGHAVEHPWGKGLGVGLHALHLIGGGVWLGSLGTMLFTGLRSAGGEHAAVARMVRSFSPMALAGAGTAAGAGALLGFAYIGDLPSLVGTQYGRTLLVKVGLLLVTMGLGAWNWRRMAPRLGQADATRAIARSATVELVVGLLLVAATAVLVALPAPRI